jgi:hypothetical protein
LSRLTVTERAVSAWTDVEASFVASEVFQVRLVGADWGGVARATFIPSIPHTRDEWSTLVAILGTTISPYLFFWQASEEVEEEKSAGQSMLAQGRGATLKELELRNIDVGVGAFFSNMVMFFIILTTAITLNRHGITHIEATRQAAEALRPLAGKFAATLFTVGIVGVGFLAIPTLATAFPRCLPWLAFCVTSQLGNRARCLAGTKAYAVRASWKPHGQRFGVHRLSAACIRESRRSTRVPLKVVITVEGGAESRTFDGETIVVRLHGALIATEIELSRGMKISIHVYVTDKRAAARVVFVDPKNTLHCGIELDEPQNILGVSLLPDDWEGTAALETAH